VNYNFPDGWYLSSSPIIAGNWSANTSQRWNVPIGGGIGKIFKIGDQPMNVSLQAFDYIDHPSFVRAGLSVSRCSSCSLADPWMDRPIVFAENE